MTCFLAHVPKKTSLTRVFYVPYNTIQCQKQRNYVFFGTRAYKHVLNTFFLRVDQSLIRNQLLVHFDTLFKRYKLGVMWHLNEKALKTFDLPAYSYSFWLFWQIYAMDAWHISFIYIKSYIIYITLINFISICDFHI